MLVTGLMVPTHLAEERRKSGWVLTVWSRCLEIPLGLGKQTFVKARAQFPKHAEPLMPEHPQLALGVAMA